MAAGGSDVVARGSHVRAGGFDVRAGGSDVAAMDSKERLNSKNNLSGKIDMD